MDDMIQEQFKMDLLKMEDIVDKCIEDGVLTIGTGCDPLFIQIMDKNAFGEKILDKQIIESMEGLCRKTMYDNKLICLFTHTYIKDDYVICFGATAGKEFFDLGSDIDYPDGIS